MSVLQRYFTVSITKSVGLVLLAFLGLTAFMDLTSELKSVGRNGFEFHHALLYVAVMVPQHVYEVMPVAALIGTIYTMAQFASSSEFTIMRAAGMSTRMAGLMLFKTAIPLVVITFIFGELIAPRTALMAERLHLTGRGTTVSSEFRTGLWTKDIVKSDGLTGSVQGSRFFNVRQVLPDSSLVDVKLYEFDSNFRLRTLTVAKTGTYQGNNIWRLRDVTENRFSNPALLQGEATARNNYAQETGAIATQQYPTKDLVSEITPKILSVSGSDPERMSANELAVYTRHLQENRQGTERFKIAFWKKIVDPLGVFVLMALALPFAYLHTRSGGVSLKIFVGIMIGVGFLLVNTLFSHVGVLSTLPAYVIAVMPSLMFLALAIGALAWVERH